MKTISNCNKLELGEKIQTSIQDEDMLNFYLKEQYDHKNRNANFRN